MKCPRCEIGSITKATMKKDSSSIHLCEYCGSMWFSGEMIRFDNGHFLAAFSDSEDREYILDESNESDQEHESANRCIFNTDHAAKRFVPPMIKTRIIPGIV